MTILQPVTELDTTSQGQIPESCSRTLSPETLNRLRAAHRRKKQDCDEWNTAVAVAAAELGLRVGQGALPNAWNRAIAAFDAAHPDWRGYTVTITKPALRGFAA